MSEEPGTKPRSYLLLQGPHGPFFRQLGRLLRATGATYHRVGFNRADQFFWGDARTFIPYRDTLEAWPEAFTGMIEQVGATDVVVYGDARPIHAQAIAIAKARGLRVHVFEEGYLRPYWITYERDGSNGNSKLMSLSLPEITYLMGGNAEELAEAPDHWGTLRQHIFYGALYHFIVMTMNASYRRLAPHRGVSVLAEFRLYLRKLLTMPWTWARSRLALKRLQATSAPYHLVLLQLEHDASFQSYSSFESQIDFVSQVIDTFVKYSAPHHHIAFKAHPLEDGRARVHAQIEKRADQLGITDRVHYIQGGKLGRLLDHAFSVVTVNSTAGQQALWRGLPLFAMGQAVYHKPEFISSQSLGAFFASPDRPDHEGYQVFRSFLLRTSQIPGSFYSARGRRQALRLVVEAMLHAEDPYAATPAAGTLAASAQHIGIA